MFSFPQDNSLLTKVSQVASFRQVNLCFLLVSVCKIPAAPSRWGPGRGSGCCRARWDHRCWRWCCSSPWCPPPSSRSAPAWWSSCSGDGGGWVWFRSHSHWHSHWRFVVAAAVLASPRWCGCGRGSLLLPGSPLLCCQSWLLSLWTCCCCRELGWWLLSCCCCCFLSFACCIWKASQDLSLTIRAPLQQTNWRIPIFYKLSIGGRLSKSKKYQISFG